MTTPVPALPPQVVAMKRVALACLAAAAVIFIATHIALTHGGDAVDPHRGWLGFVQAAAEAGMVGGLADWFAVTALFRRPLGLPIPHTAIIPERKKELGAGLAEFVGDHFLTPETVGARIRGADIPKRLGGWLETEAGSRRVVEELTPLARRGIDVLRADSVRPVAAALLIERIDEAKIAAVAGRVAQEIMRDGSHHPVVTRAFEGAVTWLDRNTQTVVDAVSARAPEWTPAWMDELVALRLHKELCTICGEIATNPDHEVRRHLDDMFTALADRLVNDPDTQARVEEAKMSLLRREEVQQAVADIVSSTRRVLLEQLADPDSVLLTGSRRFIASLGNRLQHDERFAAAFENYLTEAVTLIATRHSADITALISETIDQWDPQVASARIEAHAGRDLQFIRINGTLVGALVGLVLHAITLVV